MGWKGEKAPAIISRTMKEADNVKKRERDTYDAIAEAYDKVQARYNAFFASDMIDMLFPQKYDAGRDVAGGSGTAGLKLAERVGPEGSVTIIDVSPEMLRLAEKNAASRKLNNVRTHVMDAEQLEFPDNSFDIVTCSFGVMSFPNVSRAVVEMKRVLKPGGRIGIAVWSLPERFPLYSEPMTAFLKHAAPLPIRMLLKTPVIRWRVLRKVLVSKSPFGDSPARFCENGSLEKYLHEAGLQSVRRVCCAYPLEFDNFDEYWETMMEAKAGGTSKKSIPGHIFDAVREELRGRLVNPRTGAVRLFNEAAIILARKPS